MSGPHIKIVDAAGNPVAGVVDVEAIRPNYKALSVKEPWASLIAHHGKTTENRRWYSNYRGPLVICASKLPCDMDDPGWAKVAEIQGSAGRTVAWLQNIGGKHWPTLGMALALVDMVGCDTELRTEWDAPGQWHFRLENIRPFHKWFPVKGRLGFYHVDPRLVEFGLLPPAGKLFNEV